MERYAIGVDLGGTKIEAALVSDKGVLVDRVRVATEADKGPALVIDKIAGMARELCDKHPETDVSAIGIGVAGQVERGTGTVVYAPNLVWDNVDLGAQLTTRLGKPVAVCNDVRAAGWGEWRLGAGVDCDNLVCIFVGTGVGGAIICNGSMLEGCNNTAGEIGHITVKMHGPVCNCGNAGCLEAIAGGLGIKKAAQDAIRSGYSDSLMLLDLAEGDIEAVTAEVVAAGARQGNRAATELMANVEDALVAGVTSIVNLLGPCRVILGGGIIEGTPAMVGRIEAGVRSRALKAASAPVKIQRSGLHSDSGAIGAALFAMHTFPAG